MWSACVFCESAFLSSSLMSHHQQQQQRLASFRQRQQLSPIAQWALFPSSSSGRDSIVDKLFSSIKSSPPTKKIRKNRVLHLRTYTSSSPSVFFPLPPPPPLLVKTQNNYSYFHDENNNEEDDDIIPIHIVFNDKKRTKCLPKKRRSRKVLALQQQQQQKYRCTYNLRDRRNIKKKSWD